MNRDCNGDFFSVRGNRYYCCLLDSSIWRASKTFKTCPNCERIVIAEDAGECEIETREYVKIPKRGDIEMPREEEKELFCNHCEHTFWLTKSELLDSWISYEYVVKCPECKKELVFEDKMFPDYNVAEAIRKAELEENERQSKT
jgi:RNase P subunit RPR2